MRQAINIFFLFLIIYLLFMSGHLYSPDEEIMYRTTASICDHFSLAIEPLYGFATRQGIDGNEYAQYGIAQSVLAAPLYFLGKFIAWAAPKGSVDSAYWNTGFLYHDLSPHAFWTRWSVSLFNQIVAALTCALLYLFCFELTREKKAAFFTTLLYGLGSLAFPHAKTFFSEPLAAFFIFGAMYFLFRSRNESQMRSSFVAGVFFALALLTRIDSVITFPAFVLLILLLNRREALQSSEDKETGSFLQSQFTRHALQRATFFVPILVAICILLLLNLIRFGHPFASGYSDQPEGIQFSTPLLSGLYGYLFSVGKGLFFFSPVLFLFFFSIGKFSKEHPELAVSVIILVLLFLMIQAKWRNWTGGWCWGPRHIFLIHIFLALPISMILTGTLSRVKEICVGVVLVTGIFVQIYGASESPIDFYLEFYRTPDDGVYFSTLYSPEDAVTHSFYMAYEVDKSSEKMIPVPLWNLQAPINDSIYIPQHSQWYGYAGLLGQGRHDFFWLHLLGVGQKNPIVPAFSQGTQ